jgi:hypothetical protein
MENGKEKLVQALDQGRAQPLHKRKQPMDEQALAVRKFENQAESQKMHALKDTPARFFGSSAAFYLPRNGRVNVLDPISV